MSGRTIALGLLFSEDELQRATTILQTSRDPHHDLVDQVTGPALPHINQVTGQKNHAGYWAYLLEFHLGRQPAQKGDAA